MIYDYMHTQAYSMNYVINECNFIERQRMSSGWEVYL